ncbi:unnamed protein product [Anisakis simplex]|uniref:G_PROTEIN_RECEP_F1_2 domain-containing protein n=1 Tax=Anisakis simplex TaxID=6269 RepID=A0A0M3K9E3_ANISI|nr:unnamed protein product [Anisakis simplex]
MIAYRRRSEMMGHACNKYLIVTQTTITLAYIIFWCLPSMIYLVAIILRIQAVVFGTITLVLSVGSGCFASLSPFLFLWKHTEFRAYFMRFYHIPMKRTKKITVSPQTAISLAILSPTARCQTSSIC